MDMTRKETTPTRILFVEKRPSGFLDHVVSHTFAEVSANVVAAKLDVQTHLGDVCALPRSGTAFVSPGNSLGFMDGGIDFAYSRVMFPGCEQRLKTKIRTLGKFTNLGRPYLPVGSAIVVPSLEENSCLIAAPTMFLPHDVSKTRNAYHAFSAALGAYRKYVTLNPDRKIHTLVCPAMCCGYGRMAPEDSARQVAAAYADALAGKGPEENDARRQDAEFFVTRSRDAEQPVNYDNREIKDILPHEL